MPETPSISAVGDRRGWRVLAVVPSHLRLPDDPALWPNGYDLQTVADEAGAKALAAHAITHPEITYVEIHRDGEVVEVINNPSYVETRPTTQDGTLL